MCFNAKYKDLVFCLGNQPVNLVEHETYLRNNVVSDIVDRSISHTVQTLYIYIYIYIYTYIQINHVISDKC